MLYLLLDILYLFLDILYLDLYCCILQAIYIHVANTG